MFNKTKVEEKQFLEKVQDKLRAALAGIYDQVKGRAGQIRKEKSFLWENKRDMDHAEKVSVRQSIDMSVLTGEAMLAKQKRIEKLLPSPYFGRFDFREEGDRQTLPVYIGIHAFFDQEEDQDLIYDWRAPIATMFYDYETGEAGYQSREGAVSGEITLKRQYRICNGNMEFMLESALNIHDDILQEELSRVSDDKMKNIVATIQRDQNAVIRNENSQTLIIQGVAGSGKTSIALHRIAFLLYRFKDSISSEDILILSPNKVFADYISNVLPELGEENIPEIEIEKLAHQILKYKYKFQTFFEQVNLLLEKNDKTLRARIREKSSLGFVSKLDEYIGHIDQVCFCPADITVGRRTVPASFIKERFSGSSNIPVFKRLAKVAKEIELNLRIYHHYDIKAKERAAIKKALKKMFVLPTLRSAYKNFYAWLGRPELFKPLKGSVFEYSDIFPLIYLKMRLEGIENPYGDVKHLLVDEMQDYTPIQYALLSELFPCKKTILGDANQAVNPFSASSSEKIKGVFEEADCVKLCKSYRSSYEITEFTQKILPNDELVAIERRGEAPRLLSCQDTTDEIAKIISSIGEFQESSYHTLGVICKTQKQAEQLYQHLHKTIHKIHLLGAHSSVFREGVLICSAQMAKGLEFDWVIVPGATEKNYSTEIDRNLLYVACTRAMHQLTVTFPQQKTKFI